MPEIRRPALFVAAALALLPPAPPLRAQDPDWTELTARRQVDGVTSLEVSVEYVAGELEVGPADEGLLYDVDLRFDAARLQPDRTWEVRDGVGRFGLRLGTTEDDDVDWKVGEHGAGRLHLGLSREIPASLTLEVGAADSRLDFGGIPLTGLVYRTGASRTEMTFSRPNPVRIARLELAAGAAEFEASGLGNARFDELEFEGAVGDVTLDFGGEWSGDAEAEISVGLGALRLVLPRGVGVRVEKSGFLAGFSPGGMQKVDGGWQTPGWDSAPHHLRIRLKAAFGKIDVSYSG